VTLTKDIFFLKASHGITFDNQTVSGAALSLISESQTKIMMFLLVANRVAAVLLLGITRNVNIFLSIFIVLTLL
jgi:hypothetical protein